MKTEEKVAATAAPDGAARHNAGGEVESVVAAKREIGQEDSSNATSVEENVHRQEFHSNL